MPIARLLLVLLVSLWPGPTAWAQSSFHAFESGPVRPMALSPDGARLYVVNTPDNRLEIFRVFPDGIAHLTSVPVGMEPVAVAARSNDEVWVVNHLSDSVSIVNDDRVSPSVRRTLLVGDEPRDIVFSGNGRAFVSTAHRGQHRTHSSINGVAGAGDPQLTSQGIGRADVWVFDPAALGSSLGGTPLAIVGLFGDTPRALAVSPDGNTVYAAIFQSGNQTAVVGEGSVCNGFASAGPCSGDGVTSPNGLAGGELPGGNPGPSAIASGPDVGIAAPEVGLVVKFDPASGEWRDELGRNWSNGIRFHLPDHDVFAIDATTLGATGDFEHVGTILFNMTTNPVSGKVYVSNTDSQNLTRFEGPGGGGSSVQGNLAHSRITVITPGSGLVEPRHLNKHIDYSLLPAPPGTKDHSLATPLEMAVDSTGSTLYVAAFGSGKVGVFPTAALEADSFDPTLQSASYIPVTGGGPGGLVLDEARDRLYVFTRFDNGVSVIDTITGTESFHLNFHNPEPSEITDGRFMLYDAQATSSNGEASCSSCHIFGDFDSLAWDLGDPDGEIGQNPNTINLAGGAGDQNGGAENDEFHPMKGAMTTQTLRGMATSGHMHWRGDRASGFFGTDAPDNDDEDLSFRNFIVAFPGLVGLDIDLSGGPGTEPAFEADMQRFSDFQLQVLLPPNPIRSLDNALASSQIPGGNVQAGRDFFFGEHGGNDCSDGVCIFGTEGIFGFSCNGCHVLDPAQGFFGTNGHMSFENEVQIVKIPHLRNLYQKVGMFGMPDGPFFDLNPGANAHQGDQVRGTGYLHDGSTDTVFQFLKATVFNNNPAFNAGFDGGDPQRRDVEAFMLAFDSDLAPIVGQQLTLDATTLPLADTAARLTLLEQRAGAPFTSAVLGGVVTECDLIVKGQVGGVTRGWLYDPVAGEYEPDSTSEPNVMRLDLETLAATVGQELTFTCVPPGAGVRAGLDRDEDGVLDFDEIVALTDPNNPGSIVGACNDGIDNDGDGATDLADPGCFQAASNIENPQCNDGVNNDVDGLVDLADPHCNSAADNREAPASGCGLLGLEALPWVGLLAWRRRRSSG
jgi:DNA-binding beta-propeller fold protein YncE